VKGADSNTRVIDQWFPCAAVDEACGNTAGSGLNEKAIFTWFASRPIAQARAAVMCALMRDSDDVRLDIAAAVRGDRGAIHRLADEVTEAYDTGRPVVLDVFSGRGIVPLEAARLGATVVGLDLSPIATLAGRLLADYPLRDWSAEPPLPWKLAGDEDQLKLPDSRPRLIRDAEIFLHEVGRRTQENVEPYYPKNANGTYPWGYLWAISIPCDGCGRRFPLVGSLLLRHPNNKTNDPGQALRIETDDDAWLVTVIDGAPDQNPTYSSAELASGKRRKGKSARCPFCLHVHSLETVKAKGIAREYRDELLVVADTTDDGVRVFRQPRREELKAVASIKLDQLEQIGQLSAIPDESIPEGNVHTVMASGYGYTTFGQLMSDRQALQFAVIVRAIRACHGEMIAGGASAGYARALAAFASATLVRRLRRATRGCAVQPMGRADGSTSNTVKVTDLFANESKLNFGFDWFETGPGLGPGTWASLSKNGLRPYATHVQGLRGRPARFRQADAMALPYRDGSVDAVITDPPYYDMIEYADASDLAYTWLKRVLFDIEPDLFGPDAPNQRGLQSKDEEIIVRRVHEPGRVKHDKEFYEKSLAKAFAEARRVLRSDGHLVIVFGHSDPDAWKRLLAALHDAGFVVTSSWPSRTESANTGVASIKVTVTIGCRVAAANLPSATAAEVDRQVMEAIKRRVQGWNADGLALVDQMMAAYGPAMEVYGRYSSVLLPDGSGASLERYLTIARRAVREATALRLDEIPLQTFDAITRFAVFWMRVYGRANVPKGEARFLAQADNLRLEDVRGSLLKESGAGFRLLVDPPTHINAESATFDVARGLAGAYRAGGTEAAADVLVRAERAPDDEHLWAVVGDLVSQLPPSDETAKALAAIQRNVSAIQNLAKGLATAREDADPEKRPTLFAEREAPR
jgi:adenine-specific DNA methylase